MTVLCSWETLNAYVDGELTAEEAAAVARAVAADADLAREVAALSALKAGVAAAVASYPGTLATGRTERLLPWAAALAALTLFAALLGGLAWKTDLIYPAPGLSLAESAHGEWIRARAAGADREAGAVLRTRLDSLRLDAYVPDLAGVGLRFSGVHEVAARGGAGIHVGYLGPRGCSVSLVVFPRRGGAESVLERLDRGARHVHYWRTGGADFYLLAQGMDPERLAETARVVFRMTRVRLPLDPESVLALERAREQALPCVA